MQTTTVVGLACSMPSRILPKLLEPTEADATSHCMYARSECLGSVRASWGLGMTLPPLHHTASCFLEPLFRLLPPQVRPHEQLLDSSILASIHRHGALTLTDMLSG